MMRKNSQLAKDALEKWLKIKDIRFRKGHIDTLDPAMLQPMLDFAAIGNFLPRKMSASEMIYTPK